MCSFKCGDDGKKRLKDVSKSQSNCIKFEEEKNFLDREEFQRECDKSIIRSLNHGMYLQRVKKPALPLFEDERCYLK